MDAILPGFEIDGDGTALLAAALIGLVNALVWPVLIRIALPFTVLTLGLGVLVLNGAVILIVARVEPSMHVRDMGTGMAVAIGITIVNTFATALLAIDDDDFYYRNVLKRAARRHGASVDSVVPGVYFLEIDGLAHDVIRRAIRDGHLPTLARWVRTERITSFPGRPTGRRRRVPARPASCMAPTTTCLPFAGGRRSTAGRSSRTTRRTRPKSSGGTRTGAAFCMTMAPAGPTSSPATRRTRC